MLDDIDETIEALLHAELPADIAEHVSIGFATPDERFPPSTLSLPAINFFLFDLREHLERRSVQSTIERTVAGSVVRVAPPVYLDCCYLVTAAAQLQDSGGEQDEHRILGAVLKVLLRHRELPSAILQGSLANAGNVRAAVAHPEAQPPSVVDLWQALGGKPRLALRYVLTVPVDVSVRETTAGPALSLRLGG